jgi:hypothetical protein
MAELKTRVEELKMENEYQLRLKDMNFNDKVKEITEKYMQEIEALKITSTVLKTEREKEQVKHEEEMQDEKDRHNREMLVWVQSSSRSIALTLNFRKWNLFTTPN